MNTPVSLVIPVFNESKTIGALIRTINGQSYPPSEIILVDGGSTDDTAALITEWVKTDSRYRIVNAGRAMPGKGRNTGAALARHEWIAFTDAGIVLDTFWLERLVRKKEEEPSASVIYGNFSPQTNTFFEKCAAISYVPPQRPGMIRTRSIASCLLKKEVWEKTGGFPDWRATEDLVFMENVDKAGSKFVTAPDAIVYWQLRPGFRSTFKKFELYSLYNVWAGRQAHWHYGIARQYAFMVIPLLLGVFQSPWWLLAIPAWSVARVLKRTYAHRYEFGIRVLFNPVLLAMVAAILYTIDLATFSGWVKALRNKKKVRSFSQEG